MTGGGRLHTVDSTLMRAGDTSAPHTAAGGGAPQTVGTE